MRLLYKSPSGEVFEYDSEHDRNAYGSEDLVPMTETEIADHLKPPTPTREEQVASADRTRDSLLEQAAIRIAPLQDAVDLEDATPKEVALLVVWKRYRVDVNRVDRQPGYPGEIDWPAPPG